VARTESANPPLLKHPSAPGCFWSWERTSWLCEREVVKIFKVPPRKPGQAHEEFSTDGRALPLPGAFDDELPGTRGSYWETDGQLVFHKDKPLMHTNLWSDWSTTACWFLRSCVGGHTSPQGHRWLAHREDWAYRAKVLVVCSPAECPPPPGCSEPDGCDPSAVALGYPGRRTEVRVEPTAANGELVAADLPVGGSLRPSRVTSSGLAGPCRVTTTVDGIVGTPELKPCTQVPASQMYQVDAMDGGELTVAPGPGVTACEAPDVPRGCDFLAAAAVEDAQGNQTVEVQAYRATRPGEYLRASVTASTMRYRTRVTVVEVPAQVCQWYEYASRTYSRACTPSVRSETTSTRLEAPAELTTEAVSRDIRIVGPVSSP